MNADLDTTALLRDTRQIMRPRVVIAGRQRASLGRRSLTARHAGR